MKPLVSILIPAYNAERWLGETVQSALRQTWPRKEIIVVDDGSQDGTLAVAERFASSGVAVYSQENAGAAAARNFAYAHCSGDYVQWLDADDRLHHEKVERQIDAARRLPDPERYLLSGAWGEFLYRTSTAWFRPNRLWCDLTPTEWLIRSMGESLFMQTDNWLVSRPLCEAAGPWDTRQLSDDDGEYFCRVLLASDGVRFVPEAKSFYRMTPSQRLSDVGASRRKQEALLLSMRLHLQYLRGQDDGPRARAACLNYLQHLSQFFYPEIPDVMQEVRALAEGLGGRLDRPRLRRKFAWMEPFIGWAAARRMQQLLPRYRAWFYAKYDRLRWRLKTPC